MSSNGVPRNSGGTCDCDTARAADATRTCTTAGSAARVAARKAPESPSAEAMAPGGATAGPAAWAPRSGSGSFTMSAAVMAVAVPATSSAGIPSLRSVAFIVTYLLIRKRGAARDRGAAVLLAREYPVVRTPVPAGD